MTTPGISPLRLGLIGTGRWGQRYISTVARLWPDGRVQISDTAGRPRPEPAGSPRWPDWTALIRLAGVDALVVATPAATHAVIVAAALEYGLPVLVEKPAAANLADTLRLREMAAVTGTPVMVGHQHLHAPAFTALRRRSAGRHITRIDCEAGKLGPVRSDCDPLWDYGPHDLAMVIELLRRPAELMVTQAWRDDTGHGRRTWGVELRAHATRVTVRLSNAWDIRRRRLHVAFSEGGTATYDDTSADRFCIDGRPLPVGNELPLDRQLKEFVSLVAGEPGEGEPGGADGSTRDDLALAVTIARLLTDAERVARRARHARRQ